MKRPPLHVPAAPNPAARNEEIHLARLFLTKVKSRRPYATWGIAVLIGLMFALQLFVGHMDTNAAFIRMGALYPPRVFEQGEFWRLASCTLLHADWMHVLFNVYVLVVLGVFVERIIGTPRFLVLYVCSAFAGSVGSLFFLGQGFSVGASGAVWGLLGAHGVLAFRPTGLLPELMLPGVKKAAMINLGLNVLNSFRPQVDMWAHFAGGAAGALVFLLLSRGVPRAPTSLQDSVPAQVPSPKVMWPLGAGAMLLLVSLTGVAIAQGNPFGVDTAPVFERTESEFLGLSVELPASLLERTNEATDNAARELIVGDVVQDTMMISVFVLEDAFTPAQIERELTALEASGVPDGATRIQSPERTRVAGQPALVVRDRLRSDVLLENVFVFHPDRLVRVTVYRWPGFDAATPADTAVRVAESARPL